MTWLFVILFIYWCTENVQQPWFFKFQLVTPMVKKKKNGKTEEHITKEFKFKKWQAEGICGRNSPTAIVRNEPSRVSCLSLVWTCSLQMKFSICCLIELQFCKYRNKYQNISFSIDTTEKSLCFDWKSERNAENLHTWYALYITASGPFICYEK